MICIICHDKILNEIEILKCRHFFHKNCIEQWFDTQKNAKQIPSCPLCRQKHITIWEQINNLSIQNLSLLDIDIIFYISLLSCISYTFSLLYTNYKFFDKIINILIQGITYIYLTKIFRSMDNLDRNLNYHIDLYGG